MTWIYDVVTKTGSGDSSNATVRLVGESVDLLTKDHVTEAIHSIENQVVYTLEIGTDFKTVETLAFSTQPDLVCIHFAKDSMVTNIGEKAFFGCPNLEEITFPETLLECDSLLTGVDSLRVLKMNRKLWNTENVIILEHKDKQEQIMTFFDDDATYKVTGTVLKTCPVYNLQTKEMFTESHYDGSQTLTIVGAKDVGELTQGHVDAALAKHLEVYGPDDVVVTTIIVGTTFTSVQSTLSFVKTNIDTLSLLQGNNIRETQRPYNLKIPEDKSVPLVPWIVKGWENM
jgi:hypothetical protein